jgi:hypothetical protein
VRCSDENIICENFTTFIALNVFTDISDFFSPEAQKPTACRWMDNFFVIFRKGQSKCVPRIFHWGEGGLTLSLYIYIYNLYLIVSTKSVFISSEFSWGGGAAA